MNMRAATGSAHVPLADRLALVRAGEGRWRSIHGDANQNGRSYGGQLLGQAMRAALAEAPPGRPPTMMQFLFLQGAMPDRPIDFAVERLQEGKRFTSLSVRGVQGERVVLQAQVSCALPLPGPSHAEPSSALRGERPEDFSTLDALPVATRDRLALMGGYGRDCNAAIEFRIPDPAHQLGGTSGERRFRYWMKVPQALPEDPHLHAAAFAYLSDWWLNYAALRPHLVRAGEHRMYISSLNHSLWLHAPPRADQWLHVLASSTHAASGRGISSAEYHDEAGRHIATATQDCLVTYTD